MPTYTFTYNGTPTSTAARELPQPELVERVKQDYGYLGSLMDVPELAGILVTAAIEGWDELRLQGALSQTDWWKTRSEATRQWEILTRADPATAEQRVAQRVADIAAVATKQGIDISGERQRQIATDSLRLGWDTTQLQGAVTAEFVYKPGETKGQAATVEAQLRQLRTQYGGLTIMSDVVLADWVTRIVTGKDVIDSFRADLIAKGKSAWGPAIGAAFDRGETLESYYDMYRQIAAQELGINPQEVDINDPKWARPLFQLVDPKTGERGVMTGDEWRDHLRRNKEYGWAKGKQANDKAFELDRYLEVKFGRTA